MCSLWSSLGLSVLAFGPWCGKNASKQSSTAPFPAYLPVYGTVPDFALTDQSGRPVQRGNLDGKVWIASFIFTNCPDECPLMTSDLARLQSDMAHMADFRLVSISVDPERDTPVVLSQYAERFNANPERWFFLTGDKQAIYRLAKEGFRLGIVDPAESAHPSPVKGNSPGGFRGSADRPAPSSVWWTAGWLQPLRGRLPFLEPAPAFADHGRAKDTLHSTRFVLVDRLAQIRGYYESREQTALERLRQHLQMLFQNG